MNFSELLGNAQAKFCLERILGQGRASGTFLFSGPEGVGKGLFALAFAEGIGAPDIHIYRPEGKTGMHSVATMRQLIEEVGLPPFSGAHKAFIIHDAERMLPSSSNALLKTLEEPHADTRLILLSSDPDSLLPTIASRCRAVPFFSISEKEIRDYIQQKYSKSPLEARQIAYLAQGSLAKAISLAEKGTGSKRALLAELFSEKRDRTALLKVLSGFETEGEEEDSLAKLKEGAELFDQVLYWYRDRHLLALGAPRDFLFHQDQLPALEKAQVLPLPSLESLIPLLKECHLAFERSIKLKNILEYICMRTHSH